MRVLVTGSAGFVGRNLVATLRLRPDTEVLTFDQGDDADRLDDLLDRADFIFHLAGVNRPPSDDDFAEVNTGLTERLTTSLAGLGKSTPILLTSSTQAELDNPYGRSKKDAEQAVAQYGEDVDAAVYVYRLPGVFGKWSRPNYNSVVATFCHNIAHGLPITISDPSHVIELVYIDDVVDSFMSRLEDVVPGVRTCSVERTFEVSLGELAARIKGIREMRETLMIPDFSDLLNRFLYATYTSYLPSDQFAYSLRKSSDERGWLTEFVKSPTFGQIFVSKTCPGKTRGEHWHHTKVEKFYVVSGQGRIAFRLVDGSGEFFEVAVDGERGQVVDIPTGYVHNIENTGSDDLITIFWASELFSSARPDTYYEKVRPDGA